MKVRFHKGGLAESMATVFEPKSYGEFLDRCRENIIIDTETISCKLYSDIPDERIGWDKTYIIEASYKLLNGSSVRTPIAFSDHDIKELKGPLEKQLEKQIELMKARWALYRSYDGVCEELHQRKIHGSTAASLYHEKMIKLEEEMMHPRMQRNPTAILRLAKTLIDCKNSALCHEKAIKELRERRDELKKNIKGIEIKLSEMDLDNLEA